jgi:uncharacterized protein (TIGR02266 family)
MAVVIQRVELSGDYVVWLKTAINEGRGKLLSLSAGGGYVATDLALLPGAQFRLKIILPGTKRFFEVEALVNWENRGEKQRGPLPPGYGVRFTELDSTAVEAIREILESAVAPSIEVGPVRSELGSPESTAAFVPRGLSSASPGEGRGDASGTDATCPTCGHRTKNASQRRREPVSSRS